MFAPVDFERAGLLDGLTAAGFDPQQRSFFIWLGVVPYLTEAAVVSTLAVIAGVPGGAEVVFDYADPPSALSQPQLALHEARAARVAALGEPWLSYFEATSLHPRLRALGFVTVEDLGPRDLAARYWRGAASRTPERGGHVLLAATV